MLKCYNVTTKEEDEDLQKINIPEIEGHHEVEGPRVENPHIAAPLKMKQVNIDMEAEPKFMKIVNCWDDAMVDKVAELLREY